VAKSAGGGGKTSGRSARREFLLPIILQRKKEEEGGSLFQFCLQSHHTKTAASACEQKRMLRRLPGGRAGGRGRLRPSALLMPPSIWPTSREGFDANLSLHRKALPAGEGRPRVILCWKSPHNEYRFVVVIPFFAGLNQAFLRLAMLSRSVGSRLLRHKIHLQRSEGEKRLLSAVRYTNGTSEFSSGPF